MNYSSKPVKQQMAEPIWTPSAERVEAANMTRFMRFLRDERKVECDEYNALYRWSIEHPANFWGAFWDFSRIISERRADKVLEDADRMPGAKWFVGARLNFARNLLRFRNDDPALIFCNEAGFRRELSFNQLYQEVAQVHHALRELGVRPGDRVAGFMPNLPETVIAMLGAASLGAVWSSCSPDFGVQGVLDRFGQIEPKVLFVADGYCYGGKLIPTLERTSDIVKQLPTVERVVVVPYLDQQPDISAITNSILWKAFAPSSNRPIDKSTNRPIDFASLPFDHPLYIMYSSGTTGLPKSIVHGAGGTLIQHLKELTLHTDLKPGDRIFYYTTCGWMMWNWLVSGLAAGATVMLWDGSPFYGPPLTPPLLRRGGSDQNSLLRRGGRDRHAEQGGITTGEVVHNPAALWDFAAREGITVFGASAKYISALEKAGVEPVKTHDLSRLRAITSTGSPLAPESFDYVYRSIKNDVQLASISGGTDIISCFALGNPVAPVYRGELQTRGLTRRRWTCSAI